jgi:Cu/Ag efflux protein CusF
MTRLCAPFALAVLLAGCGATTPVAPVKQYPIHAFVVSVDPADHTAKLRHDAIKGFMDAMTMDYAVRDSKELKSLRPGETINGTLFVQDTEFWVGSIKEAK